MVAEQTKVGVESWDEYGQRAQTRREHLVELQTVFGFQPLTMSHYRQAVQMLTELAMQTDKGIVLASALIEHLRRQSVVGESYATLRRYLSLNLGWRDRQQWVGAGCSANREAEVETNFRARPLTVGLLPLTATYPNGSKGRVARVGRPPGFRVEPTAE